MTYKLYVPVREKSYVELVSIFRVSVWAIIQNDEMTVVCLLGYQQNFEFFRPQEHNKI